MMTEGAKALQVFEDAVRQQIRYIQQTKMRLAKRRKSSRHLSGREGAFM